MQGLKPNTKHVEVPMHLESSSLEELDEIDTHKKLSLNFSKLLDS